ncbi:MAG: glycosyltransferase N-terminal domain-containing protein [Bacteroidota bacterium]
MNKFIYILYNILGVPAIRVGFFLLSRFNKKARLGYDGRRQQRISLEKELKQIPKEKKRILIHCTSVGEYEQAVPVINLLKRQNPELYLAISFFSASGYNFVKKNENVDLKIYLPLDVYSRAEKLLSSLKPSLFIISKFDVWPNFVHVAGKMGVSVVMIAATLSENSKRDKGLSKRLNRYIFKNFDFIFPISKEDKNRFLAIYPFPEKMQITGDTRFDQVYKKGQKILAEKPEPLFSNQEGLTFIGGSIWPADEKHLLPVLIRMLHKHKSLKAILVPHELHEEHIKSIENVLQNGDVNSVRYTTLPEGEKSSERVIIVNSIGMLAKLYATTDFAYVGGSFSTGVHNVMEPAVFGQPVIFGPIYVNSFEALELQKIESGFSIRNETELEKLFDIFVSNHEKRIQAGGRAEELIKKNVGASDKIFKILNQRYGDINPGTTKRKN